MALVRINSSQGPINGTIGIIKPNDGRETTRLHFEGRKIEQAIAVSTFLNDVPALFRPIVKFFASLTHIAIEVEILGEKQELLVSKRSLAKRAKDVGTTHLRNLMADKNYTDIFQRIHSFGQSAKAQEARFAQMKAEEERLAPIKAPSQFEAEWKKFLEYAGSKPAKANEIEIKAESAVLEEDPELNETVERAAEAVKGEYSLAEVRKICKFALAKLKEGVTKPTPYFKDLPGQIVLAPGKFYIKTKDRKELDMGSTKIFREATKVNVNKKRVRKSAELMITRSDQFEVVKAENKVATEFTSSLIVRPSKTVVEGDSLNPMFMYMKKYDGNALTLKNKDFGLKLQVMLDTSAGVKELHEKGVLHRDLKPANLFLLNGRGIVADLGYLRKQEDQKPGETAGSPLYMDPELMSVRRVNYSIKMEKVKEGKNTAQTDIFSHGLTMQEIFFPSKPIEVWERVSPTTEVLIHPPITFDATESPTEEERSVAQLINEMIDTDPSKRPSMAQVEERLKEIQKDIYKVKNLS